MRASFLVPAILSGVLLLTGAPAAQLCGSEQVVHTALNLPGSGGSSAGSLFLVEAELSGLGSAGDPCTSTSFELHGGAVWSLGSLVVPGAIPVVFGAVPGFGDKAGGTTVTVLGFNFRPPGSAPDVTFDGVAAGETSVHANTWLNATTPAGSDLHGNAKASVPVGVGNPFGSALAPSAFVFTPALSSTDPPRIGRVFHASLHADAGVLWTLAIGVSGPGGPLVVPPFEGAFEIGPGFVLLAPLQLAASGFAEVYLPLPDDPTLVGHPLELQGVVVTSLTPLAGAFTNRLSDLIEGGTP